MLYLSFLRRQLHWFPLLQLTGTMSMTRVVKPPTCRVDRYPAAAGGWMLFLESSGSSGYDGGMRSIDGKCPWKEFPVGL